MNKFNLTFKGDIQPEEQPEVVRRRFAQLFGIDDSDRLEQFFSGKPVVLRRHMERREAAQWFQEMRNIGAIAELVKASPEEVAEEEARKAEQLKQQELEQQQRREREAKEKAALERAQREEAERLAAEAAALKKQEQQARKAARDREKAKERAAKKAERERLREERKAQQAEAKRLAAEESARKKAAAQKLAAERAAERQAQRAERAEKKRLAAEQAAQQKAAEQARRDAIREEEARQAAQIAEQERLAAEEAEQRRARDAAAKAAKEERRKAESAHLKAEGREKKRSAAQASITKEADKTLKTAEPAPARQKQARKPTQKKAPGNDRSKPKEAIRTNQRAQTNKAKGTHSGSDENLTAEAGDSGSAPKTPRKARREAQKPTKQRAAAKQSAKKKPVEHTQQTIKREAEPTARKAKKPQKTPARNKAANDANRAQTGEKQRKAAAQQHARDRILHELTGRPEPNDASQQGTALGDQAVGCNTIEQTQPQESVKAKSKKQGKAGSGQPVHKGGEQTEILSAPQQSSPRPAGPHTPGAPNLYNLKAFRVTPDLRERAMQADRSRRRGWSLALAATLLLCLGILYLRTQAPIESFNRIEALAADRQGQLYLLSGGQLFRHDRAGVAQNATAIGALGLSQLGAPLHFLPDGALLGKGLLAQDGAKHSGQREYLVRCDLTIQQCERFSDALDDVVAAYPHRLDGSVFALGSLSSDDPKARANEQHPIADATAPTRLVHLSEAGKVLNSAAIDLPENPQLRPDGGLLLVSSAQGPAISVYRYDASAFGQQLDEILLLAPTEPAPDRVIDFARTGDTWWALLGSETSGERLFQFDQDWGFAAVKDSPYSAQPIALGNWGEKLLARPAAGIELLRFSPQGNAEAPFSSTLVAQTKRKSEEQGRIRALASEASFTLVCLICVLGLAWAYLNHARALVYKSQRLRGAEPVDDLAGELTWIPPAQNRQRELRRRGMALGTLSIAACLLAIGSGISAAGLAAVLCLIGGAVSALLILQRKPMGHIGLHRSSLLLVDHSDRYHFGAGSDIHYRGNFLIIEDIVVHAGNLVWPTFDHDSMNALVVPLVSGSVKIDRKTLWVKLIESRHPLALALLSLAVSGIFALLALQIG